jgi:GT2 family glycosyltransferase
MLDGSTGLTSTLPFTVNGKFGHGVSTALVEQIRSELLRVNLTAMRQVAALPKSPTTLNKVVARPTVAAVMVSFNKRDWVRRNIQAQLAQSVPFDKLIVVDNCSRDGSVEMIRAEFPSVHLVVMPHSNYGACETFNIGFKNADTDFIAILDDDVELSPNWVELTLARMQAEPSTTAMISSKVIEPGEPDWYTNHPEVNRERYMATFRGCATLARREVIERCGFYDEEFFIYGNERDLAARVLSAGYRILQFPAATVRHGTPFGMKAGARSLYYHVRNLWWYLFKHASFMQILTFFWTQLMLKVGFRTETLKADAIGTIGIYKVIGDTPGGWWIVTKATFAAFVGLPRCIRLRKVCRHPDFTLPTK